MSELFDETVHCPYCGEPINVLVDTSAGSHDYIEDCQVCCRPILFTLTVDLDGDYTLTLATEND